MATITGTSGGDNLFGDVTDDSLIGDAGNDTLHGQSGNDTLNGGAGDDFIDLHAFDGQSGSDVVQFGPGDGHDTVHYYSPDGGDALVFGPGIASGDIELIHDNGTGNLTLRIDSSDEVRLINWLNSSEYRFGLVQFHDGTTWTADQMLGMKAYTAGTNADEQVYGADISDTIDALDGDDTLIANAGNDTLLGGNGNDLLYGHEGDDVHDGGAGNDHHVIREDVGHNGADTIAFHAGDGADTADYYSPDGNDVIEIDGVVAADTTLRHNNATSDLVLDFGVHGSITVNNWFAGAPYQLAEVRFAGDATWTSADIALMTVNMTGTAGDETLVGTTGNDLIQGLDGNDAVHGYAGNDLLEGGAGNDALYGHDGNDTFTAGTGDDYLRIREDLGDSGADTVVFNVGDGNDTLSYYSPDGSDVVEFGTGITAAGTSLIHLNQTQTLVLATGSGDSLAIDNWFYAGAYMPGTVHFSDATTWTTTDLAGMQFYTGGTAADDLVGGTQFDDTVDGLAGADSLYGYDGDDTLRGSDGNDALYGLGGNDDYHGGTGDDYLRIREDQGDSGADRIIFNLGDGQDQVDFYSPDGGDTLVFGSGIDAADVTLEHTANSTDLRFRINATDSVTVNLWTNGTSYQIQKVRFDDGTEWLASDILGMPVLMNGPTPDADNIFGSSLNESIDALAGDDLLVGGGGNDTLLGSAGNDQVSGNSGNDSYIGGAGNDILNVNEGVGESGSDTLVFNIGDGVDLLSYYSPDGGDTVAFGPGITAAGMTLERVNNSTELVLRIDADNAVRIESWLAGDAYRPDFVQFAGGTSWTKAQMLGMEFRLAGTAGDDALQGSSAVRERLLGGDGDDTLIGAAGDDTHVGGAGNDYIQLREDQGQTGADIVQFNVGDGIETIDYYGGENNDVLEIGGGVLPSGITMLHQSATNHVALSVAGGGEIWLLNWLIDDVYRIDGIHFDNGSTWTPSTMLGKTFTTNGTSAVDDLQGTALKDMIYGFDGDDALTAYAGNDTLDGGAGWNTLVGGDGNDIYWITSGRNTVTDSTGTRDVAIIKANSDLTGSTGLEQVRLDGTATSVTAGAADELIIGNALDNALGGSAGNDTVYGYNGNDSLDGGAGIDKLVGGGGDDTYTVDVADDLIVERGSSGIDTVISSVVWTLGKNFENLVLAGSAANGNGSIRDNQLTGNALNNRLKGNAGADTLTGGDGNDTLSGGSGHDTLTGDAGIDRFLFDTNTNVATNLDHITDFVSGTDRVQLDDLVFSALAVGTLDANAFVLGNKALDADDRVMFDANSGILYYDADGNNATIGRTTIAVLDGGAAITAADIQVV